MTQAGSKTCSGCTKKVPLSGFGVDRSKGDGLCSRCKSCRAVERHARYLKHRDRELRVGRAYRDANHAKVLLKNRRWYMKNRSSVLANAAERARVYYKTEEGREKALARNALRKAVRLGRVEKLPCEVCSNPKVEAHHHNGYDKKNELNVTWLCTIHHGAAHRKVHA